MSAVDPTADTDASASEPEHARRMRRRLVPWLFVAAIVLATVVIRYPLRITERAEVTALTHRDLRAEIEGVIVDTRKREGDAVAAGEVIAMLDVHALVARRAVLLAQRDQVDAELDKLQHGSRPEEIRRAREVLGRKQSAQKFAKSRLDRLRRLQASAHVSAEEVEGAALDAEVAARELAEARAELELVRAGFRSEDVRAKQAEGDRLRAEIDFVEGEVAKAAIESPLDGMLVTPRFEESIGRSVEIGEAIAEIAQLDPMRVEIAVPERELDAIELGQPVLLKVKSLPDHEFRGEVEFIAATVTEDPNGGERYVRVLATIANPDGVLKDRMTGWAEIDGEPRSLLALGLRRVVRFVRVRLLI